MIAGSPKPKILSPLRFAGTTDGQPLIWDANSFRGLGYRVLDLPQRIDPVITYTSPASACRFAAYAEVLDIWYVIEEAASIRNAVVDAQFVDLGAGEYHVYVKLPASWKTEYTAAFTQLLSVGQPVEITFWPMSKQWRGTKWWTDTKTSLTWRGKILPLGSEVDTRARNHPNFRFWMRRPVSGKGKMVGLANKSATAVNALCEMDVFATETLADNTHPKGIYVKLIPSTPVTKSRLAALIRVLGGPHPDLDIQQEDLNNQREGDEQSEAGWSADFSNDPRDVISDDVYKSRDTLAYPFELVKRGDKFKLVRGGDPTSQLTKGFLMGRYVPDPDSEINLWSDLDEQERAIFEAMIPADIRPQIVQFLARVPCGLLVIIGPPGTGKTFTMAWIAVFRSVAGKKVSCHAPTNAAASVFFNRYVSILTNNNWHDDYLALRHYGAHLEVAVVVKFLLAGHSDEQWNTLPQYQFHGTSEDADIGSWSPKGSAAAAVLFVMGKINNVQCGSRVLRNMRRGAVVAKILDLIEITVADYNNEDPDSGGAPQVNIQPDDFQNDLGNDEDDPPMDEVQSRGAHTHQSREEFMMTTLNARSLGGLIRELILQILWRASAVFSTTHVGAGQLVKKFTKVANEYFLDEAAAATIPEAAQIWRNDRPFTIGGDMAQLLPATLSSGARYKGTDHAVNPLAPQHRLSMLSMAMFNGWPCLVLKYQRRMVVGLFDLSKDIFYSNWGLSYGTQCVLGDGHQVAQRCEAWTMRKLDVSPSPQGRVLSVFIHVRPSEVKYTEVSRSRSNPAMLNVLIRTLNRLIQGAGLGPQHIAIITPYVSQETAILQALGSGYISVSDVPNRILLTTADRAQGNERSVVIFLAVNTKESGAGFLWDENRMNVISTRASDFFLVIGDIDVARKSPSENVRLSIAKAVDNKLPRWIQYFCDQGRVANRDGAAAAEHRKVGWLRSDPATFDPVRFRASLDN